MPSSSSSSGGPVAPRTSAEAESVGLYGQPRTTSAASAASATTTLDLDAEYGNLQSDNPLQQLQTLRRLHKHGLVSDPVFVDKQRELLDLALAVERAGGHADRPPQPEPQYPRESRQQPQQPQPQWQPAAAAAAAAEEGEPVGSGDIGSGGGDGGGDALPPWLVPAPMPNYGRRPVVEQQVYDTNADGGALWAVTGAATTRPASGGGGHSGSSMPLALEPEPEQEPPPPQQHQQWSRPDSSGAADAGSRLVDSAVGGASGDSPLWLSPEAQRVRQSLGPPSPTKQQQQHSRPDPMGGWGAHSQHGGDMDGNGNGGSSSSATEQQANLSRRFDDSSTRSSTCTAPMNNQRATAGDDHTVDSGHGGHGGQAVRAAAAGPPHVSGAIGTSTSMSLSASMELREAMLDRPSESRAWQWQQQQQQQQQDGRGRHAYGRGVGVVAGEDGDEDISPKPGDVPAEVIISHLDQSTDDARVVAQLLDARQAAQGPPLGF